IPSARDIYTEILQPLIDSHLDWQKKAIQASSEADLHVYFGGPRSPFLTLLGVPGRNGPSLSTNARTHVYRPFLQKLSVKRLEEELYKPYANVIIRTAQRASKWKNMMSRCNF
ncbi:10490_t:CDS:2, partial [Paraglomus brasilianum]